MFSAPLRFKSDLWNRRDTENAERKVEILSVLQRKRDDEGWLCGMASCPSLVFPSTQDESPFERATLRPLVSN
ncbi:MAG: hypothetical protein RM347_022030 [Nostoc sp. ChiQUE02]|uniref:hypothetical protein n=1 Tax=Nostoc sp. ChiQUE02 TaxID=3075377 RepID=UPI002AD26D74|nr:hypothetical protein [Nostoc sp. ChiQUE02]MDZ8228682.1 hypothetical protein [Nostoc sp. ChiQUE02]